MKRFLEILLLAVAAALLSGCGYSLAARNTAVPRGESVAVKMFANRTYEANMEGEFRRTLVEALAAKGQSVGDDTSALVISGEIASLSIDTAAFSATDKARFYKVVVEIQMQLAETRSGKVLWKGSEIIRQQYPANDDLALQRNAKEAAIASICRTGAQLLVAKMNQKF